MAILFWSLYVFFFIAGSIPAAVAVFALVVDRNQKRHRADLGSVGSEHGRQREIDSITAEYTVVR